jgi:hypothetical protein
LNDGHRLIEGQYLLAGAKGRTDHPGLRVVSAPPVEPVGGGCAVVRLEYAIDTHQLTLRCNARG